MNPLLELKDIKIISNSKARLLGINISINSNEKIALLGQSGAGKSTLIKVANGTLYPTYGSVKWKGIEVKKLKKKEQFKIGTIWQDLRLVRELTVGQNINAGALGKHNIFWAIRNLIGLVDMTLCHRCLASVSLQPELSNKSLNTLSGGQQQRVAIARLIRQAPELVLADEPLSNLDPQLVKETLLLLLDKRKIEGVTIPSTSLITLHRPELLKGFTRVIGLKSGRILFDSSIDEINGEQLDQLYQ